MSTIEVVISRTTHKITGKAKRVRAQPPFSVYHPHLLPSIN